MDELELELYQGSLAWALLHGMPLDTTQLPIIVHMRGSAILGALAVPVFAVVGNTLWALKLVAWLWTLATVALLVAVLRRLLSPAAALAGGLAYAFLPPSFQMVDVTALGSHGEAILLIFLGVWFVCTRTARDFATWRAPAILGGIVGLGLLFSMQFLTVAPALVIAWWLQEWRTTGALKSLRSTVFVGLPLGLVLAAYLELFAPQTHAFLAVWWQLAVLGGVVLLASGRWRSEASLGFLGATLLLSAPLPFLTRSTKIVNRALEDRVLPEGLGGAVSKFGDALVHEFQASWLFSSYGGPLAAMLFCMAVLVGLGFTLVRARRLDPLSIFVLLQPLFFFTCYATTDLTIDLSAPLDGMGSRYVMPVLASVTCWIAIAVQGLIELGYPRIAAGFVGLPVLAGALGLVPLLHPSTAFVQPTPLGTRLHRFGAHFQVAGGEDLGARLAWVEHLDPEWPAFRPCLYEGVLHLSKAGDLGPEAFLQQVELALAEAEPLRPYLLYQLGRSVMANPVPRERALRFEVSARLDDADVPWFGRGLGAGGVETSFLRRLRQIKKNESRVLAVAPRAENTFVFLDVLPARLRGYAAQGAGFDTGLLATPYQRLSLELMAVAAEGLAGAHRENFFVGFGLGFRTRYVEATWWVPREGDLRLERLLEPDTIPYFRAGLDAPKDEYPAPR